MKIYDISQEVFSSQVYPGDPAPERRILSSIDKGDSYNLTAFLMCAHNGTHVDAPSHFLRKGESVEQIPLNATVGKAFVTAHMGNVTAENARDILAKAKQADREAGKRILIKGDAVVTTEAAEVFANADLLLLGTESQSVGPVDAPMAVHLILLGMSVVLLEGIRLDEVAEGVYFLCAAPLSLRGSDGAPCRAILIDQLEL